MALAPLGTSPTPASTPDVSLPAAPTQPAATTVASPGPTGPASPSASIAAIPTSPAHAITSELVARVLIYPDVWAGLRPWPSLSVYADGRAIGPDGVRWLTPAGVDAVRTAFLDSGLFGASRVIAPRPTPDLGYGAGFATYVVTAQARSGPVTVTTTNMAPSEEGQRLIKAADRLSDLEAWLPASAWLPSWADPRPYEPDRWLLQVVWSPTDGGSGPVASPDLAAVDWPFGPPERFGAPDPRLTGDLVTARCAVVADADVQRLLASLRTQGVDAPEPQYYTSISLGWAARGANVELGLEAALPDDATTCPGLS